MRAPPALAGMLNAAIPVRFHFGGPDSLQESITYYFYTSNLSRISSTNFESAVSVLETSKTKGTRSDVRGILSEGGSKGPARVPGVIVPPSKDILECAKSLRLEEGYAEIVATQKFFELISAGEEVPDFGKVLRTFTPEMLEAARDFQEPTLILPTKGRSFSDLIAATNGHRTMPGLKDSSLSGIYFDGTFNAYASQKPELWRAYIIEGAVDMGIHGFDDGNLQFGYRLQRYANHKIVNGLGGVDRWKYMSLMMQALKNGRPIDSKFLTILDEDPAVPPPGMSCAHWSLEPYPSVFFKTGWSWYYSDGVRFRRSVGGNAIG